MKTSGILVVLLLGICYPSVSQSFEFYRILGELRHVPYTRFEPHQDTLFFFLESRTIAGDYYLAKFDKRVVRFISLPKGYAPTRYHMASYGGNLYMVLENSGVRTLFRYNGSSFSPVTLPADHSFERFEELEVYGGQLYLGLRDNISEVLHLFRYNGSAFTQVPLCADCFIGMNPETFENTLDEMIVYRNKLYIGGYLGFDPSISGYRSKLFVYDGASVAIVPEPWVQWGSIWDQMFINQDLLHTESFYGYDGTAIIPLTYHYAPVTGIDLEEHPWAVAIGTSLGKTVFNNAVFYSSPMDAAGSSIFDLLKSRFYSFSTDPAKAREIFLPGGYQFGGFDTYFTHLQVFNCRLFMILEHEDGYERLVAYKDSFLTVCDLPRFPFPFPFRFDIYPNPSDGVFTIELLGDAQLPVVVRIVNDVGKVIVEKALEQSVNVIDISTHGKGLYTILIGDEKPKRLVVK
jgi:hypothetical protein